MVRIDISNRALLVYGVLFILFLSIGFGIAYRSGESPSVMGHSAEELEVVNIGGITKTLQEAIDDSDFSGFSGETNYSFNDSGYIEYENGFTIQWGTDRRKEDNKYTISFPTPFKNKCFSVVVNRQKLNTHYPMMAVDITKNGFSIDRRNAIDGPESINYIAMGF